MTSMKMTLAEKPKLIPSTPPPPATLEGSLQPSQAITAGAFAKTAPINEARKNLIRKKVCYFERSRNANKRPKLRSTDFADYDLEFFAFHTGIAAAT
jgi:hypothetical protein